MDSGAEVTVVARSLVPRQNLCPTDITLTGMRRGVVHPLGTAGGTILIAGSEYPINARVLPTKKCPSLSLSSWESTGSNFTTPSCRHVVQKPSHALRSPLALDPRDQEHGRQYVPPRLPGREVPETLRRTNRSSPTTSRSPLRDRTQGETPGLEGDKD